MSDLASLIKKFNKTVEEDGPRFDCLPGVSMTWPPRNLVTVFEMLKRTPQATHQQIADAISRERSTITRKVNSIDWNDFGKALAKLCDCTYDEALAYEAHEAKDEMLEKEEIAHRRKQVTKLAILEQIKEVIRKEVPPLPRIKLPPLVMRPKKVRSPEDMVLLLSDLHVGLAFTQRDTGNLGAFSEEIFRARADNLRKAVIEILELHSDIRKIPTLHVFGLGDFVQGTNLGGEWGPAYTTMEITRQCCVAGEVVAQMLESWSNYFDRIEFDGVVGNHGRAGASKNSDKISASWDKMCYHLMQARLHDRKNIVVNDNDAWWFGKEIKGVKFVGIHGDYMKKSPAALLQVEQQTQSMLGQLFDYLCAGHFHSFADLQTNRGALIVNGSFVGGDIYSMSQLRARARPTQTLFGVHEDHGVSWSYKLDLDCKRS